jgi:hypothetical protein
MILHDQTLTEQGLSAVRQETVGYDASNPVEPSRIVGKNFLLDLRPEPFHRLELGNRVELARCIAMAVVYCCEKHRHRVESLPWH